MKQNIAAVIIAVLSAPNMACAEPSALKTQTDNNIGLSLSSYEYREPGIMSLTGVKMGVDLHIIKVSEERHNLIFRGDLRYAFGTVDYNSEATGSASGDPDWYFEARGLVGKDWVINESVFSPYAGFGYRYLFNDGRGISSTGFGGYRRESNYFYFPIGTIYRIALNNRAKLESTLEYDQLLAGTQVSSLSDVGAGYSDLTNDQSSGYGLKLSVMYQKDKWAIGPYANYWNIGQSDSALIYQNGTPIGIGWEPKNDTVEFGFQANQRF
jgi:hypothetical protein